MERDQLEKLFNYYNGSEVRIIDEHHPHYNSVGAVIGSSNTESGAGLKIRRFDTQEGFLVFDVNHLKVTKR